VDAPRRLERHWWLGLLPLLLAALCWEYGISEGFTRFAAFVYWGACVLLVTVLVASLLTRVAPRRATVLVTVVIAIAYVIAQGVRGELELVWRGGLLGLYFGVVLGVIGWFLSSRYAEKIRTTESSIYARIRSWVRGSSS
jgi:hypothetical protein